MFAQLDVNFTVKNSTADQLIIGVNVNGKDIPRSIVQTLSGTDFELLHVYHLAEKLPAGKNRVYVTAKRIFPPGICSQRLWGMGSTVTWEAPEIR